MKTFHLSARITVGAYCTVDAETLEEAIEKSQDLAPAWHSYNTGTSPRTDWCVEEIDGEPVDITGEED